MLNFFKFVTTATPKKLTLDILDRFMLWKPGEVSICQAENSLTPVEHQTHCLPQSRAHICVRAMWKLSDNRGDTLTKYLSHGCSNKDLIVVKWCGDDGVRIRKKESRCFFVIDAKWF